MGALENKMHHCWMHPPRLTETYIEPTTCLLIVVLMMCLCQQLAARSSLCLSRYRRNGGLLPSDSLAFTKPMLFWGTGTGNTELIQLETLKT
jgi:hypothetical protein